MAQAGRIYSSHVTISTTDLDLEILQIHAWLYASQLQTYKDTWLYVNRMTVGSRAHACIYSNTS